MYKNSLKKTICWFTHLYINIHIPYTYTYTHAHTYTSIYIHHIDPYIHVSTNHLSYHIPSAMTHNTYAHIPMDTKNSLRTIPWDTAYDLHGHIPDTTEAVRVPADDKAHINPHIADISHTKVYAHVQEFLSNMYHKKYVW